MGGCAGADGAPSAERSASPSESAEPDGRDAANGGRVLGVTLSADIRDDGTTAVLIEYRLETPDPLGPILLRGLAYDGRVPRDVEATFDGGPADVEWLPAGLPALRGRVTPGPGADPADAARPAAAGGSSTRSLVFRYRIDSGSGAPTGEAATVDVRLPVILVDWPPAAAPEEFFQARIAIPPGMAIVERFPTVPLRPEPAAGGARATVRMSLPAAPSVLRFRLARGASGPTFATRVDLAVIAVLLLLGAVAWRGFRASGRT